MAWHYVLNGVSQGPVEETEIKALYEQGVLKADSPVWTDGMAEWVPYGSSTLAASVPAVAGAVPSGPTHSCAVCGKLFPEDEMVSYESSWVCAADKAQFFQRIKEGVAQVGTLNYARVGKRFAAIFIDGLILLLFVFGPIMVVNILSATWTRADGGEGPPSWLTVLLLIFQYVVPACYEIWFIGKYGATPGKMAMKLKVVSPDGSPISYGTSTGRYFAKIISGLILYIGYFMAIWDSEKRALHDRMCTTRVIDTTGA